MRIAYPKEPALPHTPRPQPRFAALMAEICVLVWQQPPQGRPPKTPTWGFAVPISAKRGFRAVFTPHNRTKTQISAIFGRKSGRSGGDNAKGRRERVAGRPEGRESDESRRGGGTRPSEGAKKRPQGAWLLNRRRWPPAGRCRVLASRASENPKTGGMSGCAGGRRNQWAAISHPTGRRPGTSSKLVAASLLDSAGA